MKPAALGFRAHSGWAVLVAVAGDVHMPELIERRRVDLVHADSPETKQPYHAAAEMEFQDAERFIARAMDRTRSLACEALAAAIKSLRARDYQPGGCGILLASGRQLPELAAILGSHPLIHTAEGELFREALVHASLRSNLAVTRVKERDVVVRGAAELHLSSQEITRRLGEMGRAVGPPWRQDEKLAALAAWMALASAK